MIIEPWNLITGPCNVVMGPCNVITGPCIVIMEERNVNRGRCNAIRVPVT